VTGTQEQKIAAGRLEGGKALKHPHSSNAIVQQRQKLHKVITDLFWKLECCADKDEKAVLSSALERAKRRFAAIDRAFYAERSKKLPRKSAEFRYYNHSKNKPDAAMNTLRNQGRAYRPRTSGNVRNNGQENAGGSDSSNHGDTDGGSDSSSDPDQPDPPAPVALAQTVHPLNPDKKHNPEYRNRRPSCCWRVPWSKCRVRARAA
jgi:hypothetical protein